MTDTETRTDSIIVACPVDGALNRVPRIKLGDLPLLIDFWAGWSGPCRQMAPQFESAAKPLEPRVRLGKLDTEAEPAIAQGFAIRSIPSLVLVRHGRKIAHTAGATPAAALVKWVEQAIPAT